MATQLYSYFRACLLTLDPLSVLLHPIICTGIIQIHETLNKKSLPPVLAFQ